VAFGSLADLSCYLLSFGEGTTKPQHPSKGEQPS